MRARNVVVALVVLLAMYLTIVGYMAVLLIRAGGVVPVTLGLAILVLPLVGAYVVWREIQFGAATARLSSELVSDGRWPIDELPLRPSGRPERTAADTLFAQRQAEVDAAPGDWAAWYRLGLAYEDAGDRRRARATLRYAIDLHDRQTR
ncbi:MAG: hypothetical protein H0T14_03270 [Nocardioidaceae bacterium]|nr:hypothetical protein [Nocardioidaceae bacterium]